MASMRQQPATKESWSELDAEIVTGRVPEMRRMADCLAWPASRQAVLTRTVENEVIPRLIMARRRPHMAHAACEVERPCQEQVDRLVGLVLHGGQPDAAAYVEAMRDGGTPTETLFLDLLTPAARQLGQMWEDDTCTFSDVTIGLVRLSNVMRLLSHAFAGDDQPLRAGPSALLVQMPGEQHGFGLTMVAHFFRRAGWNVRQEPVPTSADLIGVVRDAWFGIVGISVACSDRLELLAQDIRAIRRHSRNRAVGIMVGGPPFVAHPQLAAMVGADATAADGRQAVQQAQSLVSLLAREK